MNKKAVFFILVGFALLSTPLAAAVASTYTISVNTNSATYSMSQPITISGIVSPAPSTPNSAVLIRVFNPQDALVIANSTLVNGATGAFNDTEVSGGTAQWIAGTYVVNASWGAYGQVIWSTTKFQYSPQNVTTTSSTSSSSSSTTSNSASTTSTSTSTSSSTTLSTTSSQTSSTTSVVVTTTSTTSTITTTSTTTSSTPTITQTSSSSSTQSTTSGSSSIQPFALIGVAVAAIVIAGVFALGRRRSVRAELTTAL